ncbi:MAG: hypothetical protein ACI8RZ_004965 [Myxococcota bacterium]|jgi:hypothetical protein
MNAPRPFPYKLRISHEGRSGVRLERPGRHFRLNPFGPLLAGEIAVITWQWPEHLRATAEAVRGGLRPTVIAPEPVLAWLEGQGEIERGGELLDGISVTMLPYEPILPNSPIETIYKVVATASNPRRVLSRLWDKRGLPQCAPQVVVFTFEDGKKLVYLNLALHSATPDVWLREHHDLFSGAEWLLVGMDHGEEDAAFALIPSLSPRRILFTDLIGETRRWLGMPTTLLTPSVDRAVSEGIEAHPFVSQASLRFE